MEIKYLQFLYFLKNNDNQNIAAIYKDLANACRNLKKDTESAVSSLKSVLEKINQEVCKIENITINSIYDFYKQNNLYTNEIKEDNSYQNGICIIELIYAISLKYFSVENYLDYFSSLNCEDVFNYVRTAKNGFKKQEQIKIKTVYKKIGEFIGNLKTYPNIAIQDIRNALIDFGKCILKNGDIENIESITELSKLNFICEEDASCLIKLIKI